MNTETKSLPLDPLGFKALEKVVQRLIELKQDSSGQEMGTTRFSIIVDQLSANFDDSQAKYALLKDRYSLLKRSNAALCDELVWLRDQLDDLCPPSEESS